MSSPPFDLLALPDDLLSYLMLPSYFMNEPSFLRLSCVNHRFRCIAMLNAPAWRRVIRSDPSLVNEPDTFADELPPLLRMMYPGCCAKPLRFSPEYTQSNVTIREDKITAVCTGGFASIARCNLGWSTGVHSFEVEVLKEGNGSCSAFGGKGGGGRDIYVGILADMNVKGHDILCNSGYSYDRTGCVSCPWMKANSVNVQAFRAGDRVRARMDLDARTLTYQLNGADVSTVQIKEPPGTVFYPAISLYSQGDEVRLRAPWFWNRPT